MPVRGSIFQLYRFEIGISDFEFRVFPSFSFLVRFSSPRHGHHQCEVPEAESPLRQFKEPTMNGVIEFVQESS